MAILASIDYSNTRQVGTQVQGQVFIKLSDSETGQPVNGNNVVVSYQIIRNNGTPSNQTTAIPGQRASIYTGVISDSNPANQLWTSFTITGISAVPDPDPPVNICDIAITNVSIVKSESSPAAFDAEVRVNATTSYGPLSYSLDDENYQSSPVFTNISGGPKTFYAKDANGCKASLNSTIPILSNLLIADPSVTLPGGNVSRWNAAFNPIVFTYQRKDLAITGVALNTQDGNAIVTVNGYLPNVIAGDMVYIEAGAYNGTYKVVGLSGFTGLIIGAPFMGAATGFININRLRPYYKMLTRITFYDKITGRESIITATNRPNNKGITRADISNFLQSLLRTRDESDYTQSNYRDDNLSASYKIAYAEHWDDGTTEGSTSEYISIEKSYYVLYAAKQLGERYGGNLAAYVPFASVPAGAEKAKWVTDFAEPAYSNGYPFDLGFIYSDELIGRELYADFTLLDINRNPLPGGPQTSYLLNDDGTWLLNQDGGKIVIARQSQSVVPVPGQLGLNRLLVEGPFADEVYYINVTLKYDDEDDVTHAVTQTQTIRVDGAVDDQSLYLRWIGLSGSWNYYRFVYNQEVSLDVQNAVIIKNYVSDWEHQDSIEEVISKTAGQKVKVMAEDLSVADIKGLQSIKYSPKAQMLISKNPVKWQTIVINTATYSEYETRNGQAPFSVTFNMPAINIQVQ